MKFKPITKTLVSMYAAAHMLASGCATSTSSSVRSTEPAPHKRITFVNNYPETLSELSDTIEGDKQTIGYMRKFDGIKDKIEANKDYNPQGDIRGLHSEIRRSGSRNSSNLAKILEDFSYYKNETVSSEYGPVIDLKDAFTFGAGAGAVYYFGSLINNEGEPNISGSIVTAVLVSVIGGWICELINKKTTRSQRKIYVNPYSGTERQIK